MIKRHIIRDIIQYINPHKHISSRQNSMVNDKNALNYDAKIITVDDKLDLKFYSTNNITQMRCETFFSKEPETIEWINNFHGKSVLWDIGANIGIYSLYSAKLGHRVYAFEPSVFNLKLLAMNINLNNLQDMITIVPSPLHGSYLDSFFELSQLDEGGACSTFHEGYDQYGIQMTSIFKYRTISIPGDFYVQNNIIPQPDYVKLDVDGIEHIVLSGCTNILARCKSISVEMDEGFKLQIESTFRLLRNLGFELVQKKHGKMFDDPNSPTSTTFNFLFAR